MEAAHTQNGTFEAGTTQRTLLRLEAADGGFVAGFDCRESLLCRNDGGDSCYRGSLQKSSTAYFRPDFELVVHNSPHLVRCRIAIDVTWVMTATSCRMCSLSGLYLFISAKPGARRGPCYLLP